METEDNKYRLIGVQNILGFSPEFVTPVFEKNGKYYTQSSYDHLTINSFEILVDYISYIYSVSEYQYIIPNYKSYYSVGDDYLIGFQLDDDNLFIGNIETFRNYINRFKIDDRYINIEILDLLNDANQKALLKK